VHHATSISLMLILLLPISAFCLDDIEEKEKRIYFPTQVGARWVYLQTNEKKDKEEEKSFETIEEVVQVENPGATGDLRFVTVGRVFPDRSKPTPTEVYEVSSRGIIVIRNLKSRGQSEGVSVETSSQRRSDVAQLR
jgi:hypothetical protein